MVTAEDLSGVGTVSDVLAALGDPNGDVYDDAVIERKLVEARVVVASYAENNATDDQLEAAVVAVAAYRTATVTPRAERKEAADVLKVYDTSAYLAHLRDDKDDALDDVSTGAFVFQTY